MSIKIENNIVKSCASESLISDVDFGTYFTEVCRKYWNRIALVDADTEITYTFGDLSIASRRVAAKLQELGLRSGGVVGFHCSNGIELVIALCGTFLAGGVAALAKTNLTKEEVHYQLKDLSPSIVICDSDTSDKVKAACKDITSVKVLVFTYGAQDGAIRISDLYKEDIRTLESLPGCSADSVLAIIYSSGSTGLPKGVQITHRNLITQMIAFGYNDESVFSDGDIYLHSTPILNAGGFWILFSYLGQGSRSILVRSTDMSKLLPAAEKYRATAALLYSSGAWQLSQHLPLGHYDLRSLRKISAGGGTARKKVAERISEYLHLHGIIRPYGLTETTGGICVGPPSFDDLKDIGKPAAFVSMKVVGPKTHEALKPYQIGEICVKGPMVFKGYHGKPEATAQAMDGEYLLTGDMGYYNTEGRFIVTGRLKDVIKCMDQQVSPVELEEVLSADPAVEQVVVAGVPHPEFGEAARAFVVLKRRYFWPQADGFYENAEAARLAGLITGKLSFHKHLHGGVEFVETIPETATGKPLRSALREAHLHRLLGSTPR